MKMNRSKCIWIGILTFTVSWVLTFWMVRSCNSNTDQENVTMVGDTVTSEGKVMEFEYENHKFINIVKATDNGTESFVVHDPNCKCTSKKLNNITTVITNTDNHNSQSSDSIVKANFRVVISKLNQLDAEVKTLRNEVVALKKLKTNPVWKTTSSKQTNKQTNKQTKQTKKNRK